MKKEAKRDYLRRILEFEPYDFRNDNMSSIEKAYNNFLKEFKFNDVRDSEVAKIFKCFYKNSLTPKNIVNKTASKLSQLSDLEHKKKRLKAIACLHNKTIKYFKNKLQPIFYKRAFEHKPDEAMLYINEVSCRNNLIICFKSVDEELCDYYYDTSEKIN